MWVAANDRDEVWRLDPRTLKVTARVAVGSAPSTLAADGRRVWVANEAGQTISAIDTSTNHVVQTISVGGEPKQLAVGHGYVWVGLADPTPSSTP